MRILLWHVHGSWTTAFVQGEHEYIVPVVPDRGADGRGRAQTWDWPASVVERTPHELREEDFDAVVLQRPHELHELCAAWTGRVPGTRELPAVYVEHNAPQGRIADMRHPAADRPELVVAHVTHFNELFWDCGGTAVSVIEHGVVDPGPRWTGELPRIAAVVNEPLRRGRYTGTDLLPYFAQAAPLDVFGMGVRELPRALGEPGITAHEDLPQARMHAELARRRIYLHPFRWTSLGLSLIEAMHLGMPVVALATTEAAEAIPPGAGVVSTRRDYLRDVIRALLADPQAAAGMGKLAREAALARYGLARFLADWDWLLAEVVR
jgi:glycosyltransferase involved in cell wall biosynthesis